MERQTIASEVIKHCKGICKGCAVGIICKVIREDDIKSGRSKE